MSAAQATDFASKWQVVGRYTDASGVSATVFQEIATGKRYLAIRGTESAGDINADHILALGFPSYLNPQFIRLQAQVQAWSDNGTLTNGFSIAGHSLGGYLAAAIGNWFRSQAGETYLYNAPGVGGLVGNIFDAFRAAFGLNGDALVSGITNIRGTAGISAIAGLGAQLASPSFIETESDINPINNHSIVVLTDSLSLYALYGKLAPALDVAKISALIQSASDQNKLSLESTLDALRKTLLASTDVTPAGDRDAFYTNLYALQESAAYKDLSGSAALRVLAGADAATLANSARSDFGDFLALKYLLPISIEGAVGTLSAVHAELYARWQVDRLLTETQRAAGGGNFTDLYLQDRAAMLAWKLKLATEDKTADTTAYAASQDAYFKDLASGLTINLGSNWTVPADKRRILFGADQAGWTEALSGGSRNDKLYGGGGDDVLYGYDGNDYLEGGAGADTLAGGEGQDVLLGGADDDRLEGGAGVDQYRYFLGGGLDTIDDADGLGSIQVVDRSGARFTLRRGVKASETENLWQDAARPDITYHWDNGGTRDAGPLHIRFAGEAGGIDIEHWNWGDLSLDFNDYDYAYGGPLPGDIDVRSPLFISFSGPAYLYGDFELAAGVPDPTGDPYAYDRYGNALVHISRLQQREDILTGTAGKDLIYGGAFDDYLDGGDGDDIILGGTDSDVLYGGAGNDLLYAENQGDQDNDLEDPAALSGRASLALWIPEAQRSGYEAPGAGTKGDWLSGGSGDDLIYASAGNDGLAGGPGSDEIHAGAGADLILGDADMVAGTTRWYLSETGALNGMLGPFIELPGTPPAIYPLHHPYWAGSADTIYAGSGEDTVDAGGGDDTVDAGSGDDRVAGGTGNDVLDGGEGNDLLFGGLGNDVGFVPIQRGALPGAHGFGPVFDPDIEGYPYSPLDPPFDAADSDVLRGGGGDDRLFGEGGDDVLDGGEGQDYLDGGAGNDTYLVNVGESPIIGNAFEAITDQSGNDAIRLGVGIAPQSIRIAPNGIGSRDLVLRFGEDDGVIIAGGVDGAVERFQFADGTEYTFGELKSFAFRGTDADDTLYGTEDADTIFAGGGDDAVWGAEGNDRISGGTGDDYLLGAGGDDAYSFNVGDGVDTIQDVTDRNVVSFGPGIDPASLAASTYLNGFDGHTYLSLAYGPGSDVLRIQDGPAGAVAEFRFAGGETLTFDELMKRVGNPFNYTGTDGDDTIAGGGGGDRLFGAAGADALLGQGGGDRLSGNDGDDSLSGGDGDDLLDGGEGGDTLNGGQGSDGLYGGAGDDTYVFGLGDGSDLIDDPSGYNVIRFGPGITADTLAASVEQTVDGGITLHVGYGTEGDAIDIMDGVLGRIREARFDDGSSLSLEQLTAALPAVRLRGGDGADALLGTNQNDILSGGAGNDVLTGQGGDDILDGGPGEDRLDGGAGSDTYLFSLGAGTDVIQDDGGLIRLAAGLLPQDLELRQLGDDLTIRVRGGGDSVVIQDYAYHPDTWLLKTEDGAAQPIESAVTIGSAPRTVAQWWDEFRNRLSHDYFAGLAVNGYSGGADGKFHRYSSVQSSWEGTTTHDIAQYQEAVVESDDSTIIVGSTRDSVERTGYFTESVLVRSGDLELSGGNRIRAADGAGGALGPTFYPDTVAGFLYSTGDMVVNVFDGGRYRGSWVYPSAYFASGGGISGLEAAGYEPVSRTVPYTTSEFTHTRTNRLLRAGDADNVIFASTRTLVDGGGGNDFIGADYEGSISGTGSLLFGNAGDDTLTGSWADDILIGGTGTDYLDGQGGADTYVLIDEADADLIVDTGETEPVGWDDPADPRLPTVATELDTVVFPDAVRPEDLRISWSDHLMTMPYQENAIHGTTTIWQYDPTQVQVTAALLTVEWGEDNRVQIMMPRTEYPTTGIERFRFDDGTELTRDQFLALIPGQDFGNPDDVMGGSGALFGGAGNDIITGSDGSDQLIGGDGNDELRGGIGADRISGGRGADVLDGGDGNDILGYEATEFFGAGNTYRGGTGDDRMLGSIADDTYLFDLGDGSDTISDLYHTTNGYWDYNDLYYGGVFPRYYSYIGAPEGFSAGDLSTGPAYRGLDTLHFGSGIAPEEVRLVRNGDDLRLAHTNGTDAVTLENWFGEAPRPLDHVEFADGTVWSADSLDGRAVVNRDPIVSGTVPGDMQVEAGRALSFDLPADFVVDPDGDPLTYRLVTTDGSPLPEWLSIDPQTGRLSGTPTAADAGVVNFELDAYDPFGGSVAAATFAIEVGTAATLEGTPGADTLVGTDAADTIIGGRGDDILAGGAGDDTYVFGPGDGVDTLVDAGGSDSVAFGAGITSDMLTLGLGSLLVRVGSGGDALHIEGFDPDDPAGSAVIERFTFADGSALSYDEVLARGFDIAGGAGDDVLRGTATTDRIAGAAGYDTIEGAAGDDTLDGGSGVDTLFGGTGNDIYLVDSPNDMARENAGEGIDTVQSAAIIYTLPANIENLTLVGSARYGNDNGLDNWLLGSEANNNLTAQAGNDVLQGGRGDDTLTDWAGNNLLDGGAGADTLSGGSAGELFIGGSGNDILTPGAGANVIALNRGDGRDTLYAGGGQDDTVSLGGAIAYADLSFQKSGNDLVLNVSADDSLTLKDWYAAPANHSVLDLQVVAEAMAAFDASSADSLVNRKVQRFDFQGLVDSFDGARAATPGLSAWALTDALLSAHLAASDTEALGGDLAYQYGKNGTLAGIGVASAQAVLAEPQFGTAPQNLRPLAGLQEGLAKLA